MPSRRASARIVRARDAHRFRRARIATASRRRGFDLCARARDVRPQLLAAVFRVDQIGVARDLPAATAGSTNFGTATTMTTRKAKPPMISLYLRDHFVFTGSTASESPTARSSISRASASTTAAPGRAPSRLRGDRRLRFGDDRRRPGSVFGDDRAASACAAARDFADGRVRFPARADRPSSAWHAQRLQRRLRTARCPYRRYRCMRAAPRSPRPRLEEDRVEDHQEDDEVDELDEQRPVKRRSICCIRLSGRLT